MKTRNEDISIALVDCQYKAPERAAAYLMLEEGRAAFVDNNTVHAVPELLDALWKNGLSPEQVDYLIVTHVHLDHAGGTAALLKHCPNATVLAHPKSVRHLITPERLVAGAKAVYGEETFARLYGVIEPIPETRLRAVQDGETLRWGRRTLSFFYTPGHASHHIGIHDSKSNSVLAGDAFGLGLTDAIRPGPSFLIATTAPTDFDAAEARKTVHRILGTGADHVFLAHFGAHNSLARSSEMLLRSIDQMETLLTDAIAVPEDQLDAFCLQGMQAATEDQLRWCGVSDPAFDLEWLRGDLELNAMGIAYAARRARKQ